MDRIRGFDGLRAVALIAVFLQHFTALGVAYETGGYGVWLFFVLSGFLIVRLLAADREAIEARTTSPGVALRGFFRRRLLRIAPAYYLMLAVVTAGVAAHLIGGVAPAALPWFWTQLSDLYFAFVAGRWTGPLTHLWSVAVEGQFYLLAGPALLLAPRRAAQGVCAATVVAALAADLVLRTGDANAVALYANPLTNFGAIAFGGCVGLRLPKRPAGGARSWPALAPLVGLIVFAFAFQHIGAYPPATARLIAAAPFSVAAVLSGLALAGVYLNQESRLARALEWGPLAGLGRVSYGVYLYHNLLPRRLLAGLGWPAPEAVEALVGFALALALAALSWRFVERPALALAARPCRPPQALARRPPASSATAISSR